jgi:hypothetical protein
MKIKVAQGIQVVHDGEVFADGDSADVPEAVAGQWVREGWAVGVTSAPTKGARR